MCVTPLQMLIAKKIIELNPNEIFDFVLMPGAKMNDKFKYYFNKLSEKTSQSFYYELDGVSGLKKIYKFYDFIKVFKSNFKITEYNKYYIASIDNKFFQAILSKRKRDSKIYTFDDGVANIYKESIYYVSHNDFIRDFFWNSMGVTCNMDDIKKNTELHYTIYKNFANIVKDTKFINLINESDCPFDAGLTTVKIFLGQPLYELNEMFSKKYINDVLNSLLIDYYFPHPRETYGVFDNVTMINTSLIFEDYIIDFLNNNVNLRLEIYSFMSTAGLSVIDLKKVKVFYLVNNELESIYHTFYEMLNEKYNGVLFRLSN